MAFIIQFMLCPSACGDGFTRTSNHKAAVWKLKVTWPYTAAHVELIKALNKDQAFGVLKRRYPAAIHFALIEVLN